MSDFFHGAKAGKQATSVSTPTTADSSIHFIVGTAPVHMVGGKVNEPVYASSYPEAVAAMGYSEDWKNYDICEEIYASFQLYSNGPVVMVNVLDPKKHLAGETTADKQLAGNVLDLPLEALADTVKVKGYDGEEALTEEYTRGEDYDLMYTDGVLRLERIEGGKITSENATLNVTYNAVDPTKVTKADIIGGYDVSTKKSSGFELTDSIFPKFRVIPTLFLAPNFSHDSEVAAVMSAKAENINGLFTGKALVDVDTTEAKTYTEAVEWKNKNNITQPSQLLMWPKYSLGGKVYHASVHQAGVMAKTDANEDLGGGTPCESASNKSLQIDSMVLEDGTEVLLDLTKANYLNANGIITALNFIGGFVSWGNETACYPANTDVTDYFYCVSRMFNWVANSVILSVWSKVDRKLNRRLIESVVDSLNIWLNGLMADGKILGGRIEFLEAENTETDLMAGKAKFHIYLTPPSPAKELDFVVEYDVSYLSNLFAA
ncbi:MAG: phage tail protein [Lachnospiraceae bacterium]|nr:phage tail protein [Lachnospiraceae bacterium]